MSKIKSWLRWCLFRFHWRLTIASVGYFSAPWIASPQHVAQLRDACMLVMIASLYAWAHHIGKRNGQHASRSDLFGVRQRDK